MHHSRDAGFTLIEMMVTLCVIAILAGMATPSLMEVGSRIRLGQGQREVERELQTARLKAVTANRRMRVRFNCPSARQYRMLEVAGTSAIDDDAARCSGTKYPSPPADNNPLTRPNHDGPIRQLPKDVTFGATATLEFTADGKVLYNTGSGFTPVPDPTGTAITVTRGTQVLKITVNSLGKITLVQ